MLKYKFTLTPAHLLHERVKPVILNKMSLWQIFENQ